VPNSYKQKDGRADGQTDRQTDVSKLKVPSHDFETRQKRFFTKEEHTTLNDFNPMTRRALRK